MDIMELGAIGELVGGVAVLVTLVYLAVQLRNSTRQFAAISYQAGIVQHGTWISRVCLEDELAESFRAGVRNYESLSSREQLKFHGVLLGSIFAFANNLNLYNANVLPRDDFEAFERDVVAILRTPGGARWWDEVSPSLVPSVARRLGRALETTGPEVLPLTESLPFLAVDGPAEGEK